MQMPLSTNLAGAKEFSLSKKKQQQEDGFI
jgi:hypothetical protein